MSDETAIQQLLNRYTDACNRRDWDQVMATFVPDGVWAAAGNEHRGHAAIQAAMATFVQMMDYFVQTNSAAVIAVLGDTATVRVTIRECGKFAGKDEALEVLGYYQDDLVRTDEGDWQFARRAFVSHGLHRFPLLAGPPF